MIHRIDNLRDYRQYPIVGKFEFPICAPVAKILFHIGKHEQMEVLDAI